VRSGQTLEVSGSFGDDCIALARRRLAPTGRVVRVTRTPEPKITIAHQSDPGSSAGVTK
jgi:hypothetical protein